MGLSGLEADSQCRTSTRQLQVLQTSPQPKPISTGSTLISFQSYNLANFITVSFQCQWGTKSIASTQHWQGTPAIYDTYSIHTDLLHANGLLRATWCIGSCKRWESTTLSSTIATALHGFSHPVWFLRNNSDIQWPRRPSLLRATGISQDAFCLCYVKNGLQSTEGWWDRNITGNAGLFSTAKLCVTQSDWRWRVKDQPRELGKFGVKKITQIGNILVRVFVGGEGQL